MRHVEPGVRFKVSLRGSGVKSNMKKLSSGLGPCAGARSTGRAAW